MKSDVEAVTLMEEACKSLVISGRPGKYTVDESPGIAPFIKVLLSGYMIVEYT